MYFGKPQEHLFIKRKFNVFYINMDASVLSNLAVAWQTMCDENTQNAYFQTIYTETLYFQSPTGLFAT